MATATGHPAAAQAQEMRAAIARKFRGSGLFLRREAAALLQKRLLVAYPDADADRVNDALDIVLAAVQDQPRRTPVPHHFTFLPRDWRLPEAAV